MSFSTIVIDSEESSCVDNPDTVSSTLELELGVLRYLIHSANDKNLS